MNRKTSLLAASLVTLTPFLFGQELQNQASPRFPADLLPPQELIAWSQLQKPRPVPLPLPPPDKGESQPDQQNPQPADPQTQLTPARTFTGKIVKDGDKYVLEVANNTTYQLDAQDNAKQYQDKHVRVVGQLDLRSDTIHVERIDLLS